MLLHALHQNFICTFCFALGVKLTIPSELSRFCIHIKGGYISGYCADKLTTHDTGTPYLSWKSPNDASKMVIHLPTVRSSKSLSISELP